MAPNPGCASQGASASQGDPLSPAAQRWVPGAAPGPGLGGGRRAGGGSVTVQEQSSPRFEINPLPARAAPAGAESPLPHARSPARGPARQSAPLHCRGGESGCRHHPPTPPTARLGGKVLKNFSFFFFFFSFFLFANTLYPRSKLWGEIWLVQFWLAGTRGLPAIPSFVPRQTGLLTCPLDPSDTLLSATLCMTAQ